MINLAANIDVRIQKMYEVIECEISPQVASRDVGIAPYKVRCAALRCAALCGWGVLSGCGAAQCALRWWGPVNRSAPGVGAGPSVPCLRGSAACVHSAELPTSLLTCALHLPEPRLYLCRAGTARAAAARSRQISTVRPPATLQRLQRPQQPPRLPTPLPALATLEP